MRILVAQKDAPVARFLKKGLEAEQYAVDIAADGEEALFLAEEYNYDLFILDLVLDRLDGLEVLKRLRRNRKKLLPILILTARGQVEDRVEALDKGADDYLVKPFSFRELAARLRALLRRPTRPPEICLRVDDLEMNLVERHVRRGGRKVTLTPKEFALLEYLMRNAGRALTRAMIVEHVWDAAYQGASNIVDVYINYLRNKVDSNFERKLIRAVRGVGYCLGESEA